MPAERDDSNASSFLSVWQLVLPYLLLILLTWSVFSQSTQFDFVDFDDDHYVTENENVKDGLSLKSIRWALTTSEAGFYHPLTWLTILADVELYGLEAPGGFHRTNILWHTGNVLLLFSLFSSSTGSCWKSFFVASLFAIHPMHVESVAWVSERKDVLSTFFGFLCLWCYIRRARCSENARKWYVLSIVSFILCLLSKSMLITLPFVMLLLDYWPLCRWPFILPQQGNNGLATATNGTSWAKRISTTSIDVTPRPTVAQLLVEKLPFLLLSIVFTAVTMISQAAYVGDKSFQKFSFVARICNAIDVYGIYARRMFWPVGLTVYYPHPGEAIAWRSVIVTTICLMVVSIAAMLQVRRRPYLFVGWFWYLGTLVPVIGFVQIWTLKMADRFTYVPMVGLLLALTWIGASFTETVRICRLSISYITAVVTISFSFIAFHQTATWRDSIRLYRHAISVSGSMLTFHASLGRFYWQQGNAQAAVHHFGKPARRFPDDIRIVLPLAMALLDLGRYELALEYFQHALEISPSDPEVHFGLGTLLAQTGQFAEAVDHLEKSVELAPRHSMAYVHLGFALQGLKEASKAISAFSKSVEIEPDNASFCINLGDALVDAGRLNDARAAYLQALSISPHHARAHNNIGIVFEMQGNTPKTIEHFRAAIAADPLFQNPRDNLNRVLQH